jgi:hypothetical protein
MTMVIDHSGLWAQIVQGSVLGLPHGPRCTANARARSGRRQRCSWLGPARHRSHGRAVRLLGSVPVLRAKARDAVGLADHVKDLVVERQSLLVSGKRSVVL